MEMYLEVSAQCYSPNKRGPGVVQSYCLLYCRCVTQFPEARLSKAILKFLELIRGKYRRFESHEEHELQA